MQKDARSQRKALLPEAWVDRDLSWLEFNRRVLSESPDDRTPLLERLKFLAIFPSNLDEFYMKRVGKPNLIFSSGFSLRRNSVSFEKNLSA